MTAFFSLLLAALLAGCTAAPRRWSPGSLCPSRAAASTESGARLFRFFDIYAQQDHEPVLSGADARAAVLRGIQGSKQAMVFGADHFYARKERELADLIARLLAPAGR